MNRTKTIVQVLGCVAVAITLIGFGCKPRNKSSVKENAGGEGFKPLTGGSCSTSGEFTAAALAQAKKVRDQIEKYKSDPNCSAVASSIAGLPTDSDPNKTRLSEDDLSGMNLFAMSQEVQALRRIHSLPHSYQGSDGKGVTQEQMTGLLNERLFQMIGVNQSPVTFEKDNEPNGLQRARDDAVLGMNQRKRMVQTATAAIDALGNMFDGLTASAKCPINQPGPLGSVAVASVKLLGAYAGADAGLAMKASSALTKFLAWSQNKYFREALSQLDQAELGVTISCLLETTANSYCSVRDNQELQKDVVQEQPTGTVDSLRGYRIMSKELPVLTNWLIQLKSSQPSRKDGDVSDQISIMMTPVTLQQKRLQIASSLQKARYNLDKDPQTARQQVYQVMSAISNTLGAEIAPGIPSFFDLKYAPQFRYFTMLDIPVPVECTRTDPLPIDQDTYFRNLNYSPVGDADIALRKVQAQVDDMFSTVGGQVSVYLRRNSNQDAPQVIAAFDTPASAVLPSPRQVMINIQSYMIDILASIDAVAKKDMEAAAQALPVAAVLVETIDRMDRILTVSDQIRAKGAELFKPGGAVDDALKKKRTSLALGNTAQVPPPPTEAGMKIAKLTTPISQNPKDPKGQKISIADIKKAKEAREEKSAVATAESKYAEVFESFATLGLTVMKEFDMDNFQESFIANRLTGIVQFDLQRMMRTMTATPGSATFSPVTQALLAASNDLMSNDIEAVYSGNPQKMKIDLASAQVINMTTMEALASAPVGKVNGWGTTNPIVNAFLRNIGVLTARTVGNADTPEKIAAYIGDTLNKDSMTEAFVTSVARNAAAAMVPPYKILANVVSQVEFTSKISWDDAYKAGVYTAPENWKSAANRIGRWMRPDLYWIPNWWSGNRLFTDNEAGSMATLRGTFCMQTLATPDPRIFNTFCKGAILYSVFETAAEVDARAKARASVTLDPDGGRAKLQGLSLIYDDWYWAYEKDYNLRNQSNTQSSTKKINYFQSQRVCALYDHFRANQVYFLTKPERDRELLQSMQGKQ